MPRIITSARIDRPIAEVFEFVTTPANWPRWHPSSLRVEGATDHSLAVGESVAEDFVAAGRRGRVTWTVRQGFAPMRWRIETTARQGVAAITYELTGDKTRTVFRRELDYRFSHPVLAALDPILWRRRLRAESEEALRRLKALLEEAPPTTAPRDQRAA